MSDLVPPTLIGELSLGRLSVRVDGIEKLTDCRFQCMQDQLDLHVQSLREQSLTQNSLIKLMHEFSDRAISKAEAAQASYNSTHNDLLRKIDEKDRRAVDPQRFEDLKTTVEAMRLNQSQSKGRQEGVSATVTTLIAIASVIGGAGLVFIGRLMQAAPAP